MFIHFPNITVQMVQYWQFEIKCYMKINYFNHSLLVIICIIYFEYIIGTINNNLLKNNAHIDFDHKMYVGTTCKYRLYRVRKYKILKNTIYDLFLVYVILIAYYKICKNRIYRMIILLCSPNFLCEHFILLNILFLFFIYKLDTFISQHFFFLS